MPPPITLPRRTLHEFRLVTKKHLNLKARDDSPPVRLHADDAGGTRLTAAAHDGRGVSLLIPGDRPPHDLVLPFDLLADAGAAKSGDAALSESDAGAAVVANWEERGVPRSARATLEAKARDRVKAIDPPAAEYCETQSGLGDALRAACEVTDADSGRYALGCVRLDPHRGRVEATDSHCLLIARGFAFDFDASVLLPAPHALSAAPLRGAEVRVGFAPGGEQPGLVVLSCGDWTVWTPEARDAHFPDLDRVIPGGVGAASVTLSGTDAAFFADRLTSLPGTGDERKPVTLEAKDGSFLIRAADEGGTPVELATIDSHVRGEAVCVADRRLLARALAAGCTDLSLSGPEEPVRCRTPAGPLGPAPDGATVVFATLAGDPVPAAGAVRLSADPPAAAEAVTISETPAATGHGRVPVDHPPTRSAPEMPRNRLADHANGHVPNGVTNGRAVRGDAPDAAPDHDELLERVAALGSTLSKAAGEARSLATDLRKLKRRNRAVTGALAGLKKLGSLVA